ncbi:MAG: hypothetical protein COX19_06080 [Desulfobacterales bacterium CG23_combo_of_CG06-09_8_20_14_all_51_8]|nr:MAG: hypothetical protein COX19_06080 [Desulfobacterales bacterium CG23_combo_of_CG06-09_8_20_14_all_51_8]
MAYNTYQQAKTLTGEERTHLLEKSGDDFRQVLSLIDQYGVPAPAETEKTALINLSYKTSLDAATTTQAAKGFSAVQERRLAETFLSRIELELGHLRSSRQALEKQLKDVPSADKVTENDRFGVSLLYHRSGLLDHATGNDPAAFEKFAVSADLCLKLENPKSAATNLENMAATAHAVTGVLSPDRIHRLQSLDQWTTALLHQKADVIGALPILRYHAILGVFYFNAVQKSIGSLEADVRRVMLEKEAVGHFNRGIALFKKNAARARRDDLAAGAALYLNIGTTARTIGDEEAARLSFEKAMTISQTGVFGDLEWRALLGLGQIENALTALENVPLSRAGCGPGEIIEGFGPLVFEKLSAGDTEGAFALAEKISEIERFHRTARFARPGNVQEQAFFRELYPRLEQIKSIEKQMAEASSDQKPFIAKRLENERALLAQSLGPDNENLPSPLKDIQDPGTRDLSIRLLALAEKIEETADDLAGMNIQLLNEKSKNEKTMAQAVALKKVYTGLLETYRSLAEDAFFSKPASAPPDFITLLSPQPCEAMDIKEALAEDDAVARIFHTGIPGSPFAVFVITPEDITAFTADNFDTVKAKIKETIDWTTPYIAFETPDALNVDPAFPRALSATHLLRCINSRKPFKQKLMAVPPVPFSGPVAQDYDIRTYLSGETPEMSTLDNELLTANTLFLSKGPTLASTVPTEPQDIARSFFAVYTDEDTRVGLENLLARTANLSLALSGSDPADQTFVLGHLFSIFRCPAIVFMDPDHGPDRIAEILGSYAEKSGIDAFRSAIAAKSQAPETPSVSPDDGSIRPPKAPLYLGYQGMNRKQSSTFAKKQFIDYVKISRTYFDQANYAAAVVGFENAISIAEEISTYSQYLPDLYKYARESAYRSGNNEAALKFAQDLAGLMADTDKNSKAHAEALLRLGLMHAKNQTYQQAITVIETAVHIMEKLPPDKDLIKAVTDLGIVLENATDYDTALSRFQSAADLSLTLNQSQLVGEQHLHMGRVYDLRLNHYATAIVHYEKALKIFTESDDVEKIAESSLNIGRCHRLLGNFPSADRFYAQSLDLIESKAPEQHLLKAKILIEQANNAWFQGKYEAALTLQCQCYAISKEYDFPLLQVMSLNTAGLIWWTLGDYDKALAELADALDHARRLAIRKDEIASTLNNMGLIYRDRGDYERALETFGQAVAIDTELASKWGLAYDYRNQGLTFLKMNQPEKAAGLFDEAYALSNSIGNRINASKALLGKSEALIMLKKYAEAEKAYDQALSMSRDMRLKENIWRALFGKAKIQLEFYKNPGQAETLLREAVDVIETLRSDLKIERLRENFLTDKLSVYEALVRLLADTGKPVAAFEMAERSRSRNFIDLLGSGQIGFSDDAENQLFRRQHLILSEIEANESLLAQSPDALEQATYEKSIETLNRDLENVMIDMQLKNPQLASLVSVPPVDTDQLIKWLEPGVAVISYYLLDDEIFCWILTSQTAAETGGAELPITLVRIPADRTLLEKHILEYRRIIQNLEPWEKHAKGLYDQLVAPVMPQLKNIHTLGVIPHGSLHYLSFATLYTGKNFLVDDFAFFYLPSAGVLEYTLSRRSTEPKPIPKVLAIGNPDLGDPLLDLPFAEQEVYSIQWNFPEMTLLTRERATKTWVVDNISRFNVIHFASHGEFDPINPLLSAIKLAGTSDKDFTKSDSNGNLEAGEIFGLKINADMVFLSACQTGLGKITTGDDVIGLNRSFFFAGTHTVVSSLWRVSDVSTAVLIKTFYRRYMTGDKAESLKQAAMHVKSRYPHPGYWGAFTLVGDYL